MNKESTATINKCLHMNTIKATSCLAILQFLNSFNNIVNRYGKLTLHIINIRDCRHTS